jgi:hypothetical protein
VNLAGGFECLHLGADIDVPILSEGERFTWQRAVIALGTVPDRDVRLNVWPCPPPIAPLIGRHGFCLRLGLPWRRSC